MDEEKAKKMLAWALEDDTPVSPTSGSSEATGDIPGYVIEKTLGQGGMGSVYKAYHEELGRVVAIKVFSKPDEDPGLFVERLKKEGRMMAQLEHPNILGIYDASVTNEGVPYLILEYVDGMDLSTRLQQAGTLTEHEAVNIASAVCDGLDAVHELGIVHRDIKPANILLGNDGSIKVSDFGISKDVQDDGGTQLTLTGTTVGTIDYMSPEHAAGKDLDARSDLYSVGVLLYEMMAGVTPRGAFELLTSYGVSKSMEKLVTRCLRRDPDQRIESAKELSEELKKVREVLMQPALGRRKQAALGVGAGILSLAAIVALGSLLQKNPVDSSSQPEEVKGAILADGAQDDVHREPKQTHVDPFDEVVQDEVSLWDPKHWQGMKPITAKFTQSDGVSRDGHSLVSEEDGVNTAFSTLRPKGDYVMQFKWKRYTGRHSIAVFLPTQYGNTVFEMGAWEKDLVGLQGYLENGRLVTMKDLPSSEIYTSNRPLHYRLQNGQYHHVRIHVRDGQMAIMMKREHQDEYRKVGLYDLTGKKWQVPTVWGVDGKPTLGFGSYHSQMYVSEVFMKEF